MDNFHELLGRIAGFAVIDIVGTIAGVEILLYLMSGRTTITRGLRIVGHIFGFAAGILAHEIFQVETPLNNLLVK